MSFKRNQSLVVLLVVLAAGRAAAQSGMQQQLETTVARVQNALVPDKRLELLEAQVRLENAAWLITGETTLPGARAALVQAVDSLLNGTPYQIDLTLLPSPALGDSTHAVVRVSVANLRKQPRHSAEMVDQMLLGAPLRLLKKDEDWYLVQTPYRYLAWLDAGAFVRLNAAGVAAWKSGALQRFEENYGIIRTQPNANALPVSDIVMGSVVKKLRSNAKWTRVRLPDGREGFLPATSLRDYTEAASPRPPRREDIVALSHRFTGVPYLWGGNSAKGFDCSGFTQTVFKMNGKLLARDANQQVQEGVEIVPDEKFSNVLPGDLMFFGRENRITHVGISLGGPQFIHANGISGDVHVNSLNPQDANYSAYRKSVFKHVRRVLQ